MIKGVLFDLDGTLLNTLPDLHFIANATLKDFGYPERSMDEIRSFVGYGVKRLITRALPDGVALTDEILDRMHENYLEYQNRLSERYEGIGEMLSTLRAHGVKLAIVSNKPDSAVAGVTEQYFPGMLDFATGERAELNRKPHPDLSNLAMQTLGLKPEECIYVGDADTDIETGKNANLVTLSCTWGFRDEAYLIECGADHLVHTPEEITKYVLEH